MAKKFAYVCLGILCLVAAYHIGARSAMADWNTKGKGRIIGIASDDRGDTVVLDDGETWWVLPDGLVHNSRGYLPVPVREVKIMSGKVLVTTSDEVYSTAFNPFGGWALIGTP